jgi:hypothetical protein
MAHLERALAAVYGVFHGGDELHAVAELWRGGHFAPVAMILRLSSFSLADSVQ